MAREAAPDLVGTRVLKAHREAVLESLEEAQAVLAVGGREAFAAFIAGVVLTAEDGMKTNYVVITKEVTGEVVAWGPYRNATAASNAVRTGSVGLMEGAQAGVWPLSPAPKSRRPSKKKTS